MRKLTSDDEWLQRIQQLNSQSYSTTWNVLSKAFNFTWLEHYPLERKKIMEKVDLLPLSQFTLAQKLNLMEAIWHDLSRDEEHLESPAWHDEVLKDR